MSMLITCESCSSRFRFDEVLLKGAKGALVKCPRCKERILVRNPAAPRIIDPVVGPAMPPVAPPVDQQISPPAASAILPPASPAISPAFSLPKVTSSPPQSDIDTKISPIRAEAQGEMISLVPPGRYAAGGDQAALIEPDPGFSLQDEVPPVRGSAPGFDSLENSGKHAQQVADLFRLPSGAAVDRKFSGDDSSLEDREAGPAWKDPRPRPVYQHPLFIAAAITVLLLSGGAFYYVDHVDGNSDRKPSGHVFPAPAQRASRYPLYEVQNLKGQFNKQATGESLYVVKGVVTNVGEAVSDGIRIRATLLDKDNQTILQSESFAGNLIDESLMIHMNRVRIEGFLGMRYGEGNANRDIPVGRSLPFMVVFFNPPEGVESFAVKAMNVDEAEGTQSSDTGAEKTDTLVSTKQTSRLH